MGFVLKSFPRNLYKFYSFDERYNWSRMTGKVFLSTPFLFNDPSDCRFDIINNFKELGKGEKALKEKLAEMGLNDDSFVKGVINNDVNTVNEVWEAQLKKVGILCLSKDASSKLFWGYYTNNDGFCVEYKVDLIIERIVIAYINCLDYRLTEHLFNEKNYKENPYIRCDKIGKNEIDKACSIFRDVDYSAIRNPFLQPLLCKKDEEIVGNFLINVCLKRFGCNDMRYRPIKEMKAPKLFYSGNEDDILDKYYTKTTEWERENEFRIVASLGGNMLADLGKDIVKSIRFGCNITIPHFVSLLSILAKEKMSDVPIFKMENNLVEGMLEAKVLDNRVVFQHLYELESMLSSK